MDSWSIIVAVAAAILAAFYYFRRDVFKEHGIPCANSLPILGSTWKVLLQRASFAEVIENIYNINNEAKYVGMYDLWSPTIVLRDLELIKSITVKNFEHFRNHRGFTSEVNPLFTQNLFFLKDDRWKEVRNAISPVFTTSKLKGMFFLMHECAKMYGETLANLPKDQTILELKDTFTRYTNDVIATCAFGVNVDSMKDRKNVFYVYGRDATNFNGWRLIKFFLIRNFPKLSKIFNWKLTKPEIENFFIDLIGNAIKNRQEKRINRPDVIQLLMESKDKLGPGKELSIIDMTAQAFIFFFGGFESSATLMCFAAHEIGVNEEVQRRLQDEIDQVLAECNGKVTYDAVNNMKYLDAIIYEALRLYPVQAFLDRVSTKRFELPPALPGLKPYVLEEGSYVQIPIYGIQHDEKYYEEPKKFNPDRFMGDTKQDLNSSSFLSFGVGPRMCIGNRFALLETKVLLFEVFAKCSFKPCEKTPIPMVLSRKAAIMIPEKGFWFEIQPRKQACPVYINSQTASRA